MHGREWGQTTETAIPTVPREPCALTFCGKAGMSYNQEEKHHAVQNLDQYGKFTENTVRNTQPTDRSSSSILVGK